MKKGLFIKIVLCSLLLLTGCIKGNEIKEIDGIKIYKDSTTYASKINRGGEYYKIITRYDNGKFKYLEYTNNIYIDSGEEYTSKSTIEFCKKMKDLNYDGFQSVCEVNNYVLTYGYIITDKTIEAGFLNVMDYDDDNILRTIIQDFHVFENGHSAKKFFEEEKENMHENNGDLLIIENKKIDLNN